MTSPHARVPRVVVRDPDDELLSILRELQYLVLEHPVAAQAAFSALVAEGRRFASTEEGRAWKQRLADSELVRRARIVWDTTTLEQLTEDPTRALPSAYVDAIVKMAANPALEPLLTRLFQDGSGR